MCKRVSVAYAIDCGLLIKYSNYHDIQSRTVAVLRDGNQYFIQNPYENRLIEISYEKYIKLIENNKKPKFPGRRTK